MKLFPKAVIIDAESHFTIRHHVITGGTSLCYCDTMNRAEIVRLAVNSWRRTEAGKRYWKKYLRERDHARALDGLDPLPDKL